MDGFLGNFPSRTPEFSGFLVRGQRQQGVAPLSKKLLTEIPVRD